MLCQVEQTDSRSDTNAPAPKPLNVNFRKDDNAASVCQATPTALTAVSVAALTLYDMCKAVDRGMVIDDIRLLSKQGGRSGHFKLEDAQ